MAEIDPVILQLRADVARYNAEMQQTARRVTASLDLQEGSIIRLENQMRQSSTAMSGSLRAIAGSVAAYLSVRELAAYADGFTRIQNALKVAGLEGQNLAEVQGQLLDLSGRYGVSLEELSRLYGNSAQAASDLGASQAQLVSLTEFTAQALKITGTNAVQAQGAILGLTQALASGTVRAEEFNQINEGGLRPLLQVVANTEKYGGSVAKLRMAIVDGKVTSHEFFEALLAGSAELEDKASKATLTLSGAFEALNSRLTVYFGEADKASGASAAMAQALGLLADNLDTLIPALAVITAAIGVRYVGGMVAARVATTQFTASAIAARTALVGLQTVGIAAVIAAIGSFVSRGNELDAAMSSVTQTMIDANEAMAEAGINADKAADNIDSIGRDAASSEVKVRAFAGAVGEAAQKLHDLAKARQADLISSIEARRQEASLNYSTLYGQTSRGRQARQQQIGPIRGLSDIGPFFGVMRDNLAAWTGFAPNDAELQDKMAVIKAQLEKYDDAIANANKNLEQFAKDVGGSAAPGETEAEKKKRLAAEKKAQREAEKAAREEDRAAREALQRRQEERADQVDIARARADLLTGIEDRAALEREMIALEREQRQDDLDSRSDLSAQEREARQRAIDTLYGASRPGEFAPDGSITVDAPQPGLLGQRVEQERQERLAQEALDIATAQNRNERDLLDAQSRLALSREARRDIELRLLDLAYEQERAELDAVIASKTASDAAKEIAQARLRMLGRLETMDRADVNRGFESPLERRRRDVRETAANMRDAVEDIELDAIDRLTSGLSDAAAEYVKLGGIAGDVINGIIRDLIRLAAQQAIFGGGGGGGLFGIRIPGFAKGTNYAPGGLALVGEEGPEVVELPRGSKVVPNHQINARAIASLAGVTAAGVSPRLIQPIVQQTVNVDARNSVNPAGFEQRILSISGQQANQAAANMGRNVLKAVPGRVAMFQRDGT